MVLGISAGEASAKGGEGKGGVAEVNIHFVDVLLITHFFGSGSYFRMIEVA